MMMQCRSQYELAALIRVQNLSPTSDRLQEKMAHLGSAPNHTK
jgi:hypothetical protein